tara:strand:+ start:5926 stop:6120 length:195 start_codon:yes stop_codon:yes gene_type:complete
MDNKDTSQKGRIAGKIKNEITKEDLKYLQDKFSKILSSTARIDANSVTANIIESIPSAIKNIND